MHNKIVLEITSRPQELTNKGHNPIQTDVIEKSSAMNVIEKIMRFVRR